MDEDGPSDPDDKARELFETTLKLAGRATILHEALEFVTRLSEEVAVESEGGWTAILEGRSRTLEELIDWFEERSRDVVIRQAVIDRDLTARLAEGGS
jgi:hypothetical protein